jgi:hypothetical protein
MKLTYGLGVMLYIGLPFWEAQVSTDFIDNNLQLSLP